MATLIEIAASRGKELHEMQGERLKQHEHAIARGITGVINNIQEEIHSFVHDPFPPITIRNDEDMYVGDDWD